MKPAPGLVLPSLLALSLPLLAQNTTTYQAPTGSVSPALAVTMNLTGGGTAILNPVVGPNCYLGMTCAFPSGYVGTYMSYTLSDGSTANLRNFNGTFFPVGSNNYEISGQASGADSAGRSVSVDNVQVTMRITCRSGRGGGCSKVYTGGTLTLTVNAPLPTSTPTATFTNTATPSATPTPGSTLAGNLSSTDTSVLVDAISQFPDSGSVQIDDEVMTYNGKSPVAESSASDAGSAAGSGVLLNVERGMNGTTSALHHEGTPVILISACTGNCNAGLEVTVDEILTMVNIALGNAPLLDCEAADANHDGQVTIDEVLTAVNMALNGC